MAQKQSSTNTFRKLNINIGILGHVDSGKTSIARALSTHFSTASIDKSPQEKERGITIELGFSCFSIPVHKIPNKLQHAVSSQIEELQFTLVDCPGHASLIKTIIGGAQIIDFMLLVIDINKGIQTQTAECLVLGQILTKKTQIIVVLNKMDLFYKSLHKKKHNKAKQKLDKKMNAIRKVFKQTKFGSTVQIVCITANRDGNNAPGHNTEFDHNLDQISHKSDHIEALIDKILNTIHIPDRKTQSQLPFLAAVDHCFAIKGQGTILTCTILQGTLSMHDMIEVPNFKTQRKVRCIQCYKQNVERAIAGDRVSISIAQFASKKLNRGLVCAPNTVPIIHRAIARCDRINYFKETIKSNSKFHITIGHSTTVAQIICFRKVSAEEREQHKSDEINMEKYKTNVKDIKKEDVKEEEKELVHSALDWNETFALNDEYLYLDQLSETNKSESYVLLTFVKSVCAAKDSLLIGSRFDNAELRKDVCRLGFVGRIVAVVPPPRIISMMQWKQEVNGNEKKQIKTSETRKKKMKNKDKMDAELQSLRIYKPKVREGYIDKFVDGYNAIGTDMFQKGTDISLFVGLKVELETRFHEVGTISASFGDSGNFYITFKQKVKRKRSQKWKPKVYLKSRKFLFQKSNGMTQ
eukprot:522264_1